MNPSDSSDKSANGNGGSNDNGGTAGKGRVAQLEKQIEQRDRELAWTNERLIAELHERSAAQASANAAERYDPATGLPNRRLFEEQLSQAAVEHQATGEPAALLLVGAQGMTAIRASNGFRAADVAARVIGDRLRLAVRGCDLVARVGDNEFAVMLTHLRATTDAAPVAQKLIKLIDTPLRIEGRQFVVHAAAGISVCPADGNDADSLMRRAQSALQLAEETPSRFYQFFDSELARLGGQRLQLQADLRRALEAHEFLVHFQPRVHIPTRRIAGVEALVRWLHPRFGLLPAAQFIDLAEQTGLIVPIGQTVLEQGAAAAMRWPDDVVLSVNLSAREFRGSDLSSIVRRSLKKSGLAPERLQVEITEASLGRQSAEITASIERLNELRHSGVAVALDQFGTGASSLTLLRDCRADSLNIEGGFIRSLVSDTGAMAIVQAICGLGRHFGTQVVAEGVETEEEFRLAEQAGCTQAQGYLFGRPMPADELSAFLEARAA
jgi:diguanylate cyclase (GGDEF)-like protein